MIPVQGQQSHQGHIKVQGEDLSWIEKAVPDYSKWGVSFRIYAGIDEARIEGIHEVYAHLINYRSLGHALALVYMFQAEDFEGRKTLLNDFENGFELMPEHIRALVNGKAGKHINWPEYAQAIEHNANLTRKIESAYVAEDGHFRSPEEQRDFLEKNPGVQRAMTWPDYVELTHVEDPFSLAFHLIENGAFIPLKTSSEKYVAFVERTILDSYRHWLRYYSLMSWKEYA